MRYTMTEQDKSVLEDLSQTFKYFSIAAKAVEKQINSYVILNIVPKMGIQNNINTATPIEMNLKEGWIEVGIATPTKPKIIVPSGNGKDK